MLLRDVEVDGQRVDVRFGSFIDAIAPSLTPHVDEEVIDGKGGALIPGLHDHHLHLLALAATASSVRAADDVELAAVLAGTTTWTRVIGYGGDDLDRHALDALAPHHPVRVQHRSGALWILNSAALREVGIWDHPDGRFWREDHHLGAELRRIEAASAPDLAWVGRKLSRYGITGVTDATPDLDATARRLITIAQETGDLPQTVHLLAPGKLVLGDHDLPTYDSLCSSIARLHATGQPVALHCVTRESLALSIAALTEVGVLRGDRIEHGALMDAPTTETLAELGVAVVTQPGFIADRGDTYLSSLPAEDCCDLYRYSSLIDAGATVVPSSDAPFGPVNPWAVMAAARDRRTESGQPLTLGEGVSPQQALDGYLRPLDDLGAPARTLIVGAPADMVLLKVGLEHALEQLDAELVRTTWCRGAVN